jgi:hypothetical protein
MGAVVKFVLCSSECFRAVGIGSQRMVLEEPAQGTVHNSKVAYKLVLRFNPPHGHYHHY